MVVPWKIRRESRRERDGDGHSSSLRSHLHCASLPRSSCNPRCLAGRLLHRIRRASGSPRLKCGSHRGGCFNPADRQVCCTPNSGSRLSSILLDLAPISRIMYRDKQMVVYRWISTNVLQVSDDEMTEIKIANCEKKKKRNNAK